MANLLDLPNEIVLLIVDYLQAGIQQEKVQVPFYRLADAHRYAIDHDPPRIIGYLRSLILLCRRFHALLTPILYRDILVRDYAFGGARRPRDQLNQTLEQNPVLDEHINSAFISCAGPHDGDSIYPLVPFFWYASMHSLTIHQFNDWVPLEFDDDSHVGTSPVEYLRLIDCGAQEEALASVLSWPAALKYLLYDVEQGEWFGHVGDEPAKEWTAAAFVSGNGPRINLSEFTALKTLRIYHVFLCGWDDRVGVWRDLPPNLEVLEVFYDDTDLTGFQNEYDPDRYDTFLPDLIRHKRTHLPRLHTVTIYSPERPDAFDDEGQDEQEDLPSLWELPPLLASETEAAGITLKVWLGVDDLTNWDSTEIFWSLTD
ncbi:uncharacterized protein N7477_002496 [Penicillium maclennaniae]|uniref:uncharacterized protein n=1 Tax=Penicillium maclennaniae TaxID=1343394 RepID=UPI0025407549|nr:uncharacterized protein N7477_002496 [Penicillium maclennaniae]KAJ5676863.1 hypothetical protein N7477_002496 [Penicillium maclennaniae]